MSQRIPQGLQDKHPPKQKIAALLRCKTRVITRATNSERSRSSQKKAHQAPNRPA